MKQKVVSSIGGCLLLAFLLLACPIRGQAKQAIIVTDNDNGVKVEYALTPVQSEDESAETAYNATISFASEDADSTAGTVKPTELNIKSKVTDTDGKSYTIKEIEEVEYKDSIKKITMEDGITSIYAYALASYNADKSSLENVQFPSTLEDITSSNGDGFVSWNQHPDSVIVPNWLKKMKPENGVVYAGKVAIYVPQAEDGAAKTEEITFKDGCVKIAHKAMFKNTDVTKVNIPASVKVIGGAAFDGCSNLSEVNFAENAQLEDLDWRAFYDCTALTSIKIPDSVTRIGTETFSGCTKLSVIDISKKSKLAQIEYGAFGYYPYYNMDLSSMWENKVSGTSGIIFSGPTNIQHEKGVPVTSIYLPAAAIRPYSPSGYEQSAAGLFAGCTTLTDVTIGDAGEKKAELPFEMFAKCTNLKNVNLDGNVTKIETGAFIECSSLQGIDLNGVKEINAYAFVRSGLTEVTIPESVNSIKAFAFGSCTKLETMTIQGTIGTDYIQLFNILGNTNYALRNSYLHTTNVQMYNPVRSNEEFKTLYPHQTALKTLHIEADKEGKTVLSGRTQVAAYLPSLETVTLPEGMTSIPNQTFAQCFSLKNINIPTSIETIGDNAFQYDVGIDVDFTKLTNLTSVGRCAFFIGDANGGNGYADTSIDYSKWYTESIDNGGIKNILLSDSVKTIGDSAFFGQRNVKKVVIPEGVESVGGNAFQMLASLEELEIYAPLDIVNSSSLHGKFWSNTWRYSESESNANKLKKITLGEKYSPETGNNGQIGHALFYGQSIEEIDIQMNNIQNIGSNMFMNNKNLKSFTIPKTVKTIDRTAFYGTTSLKEMKIRKNVKTLDVEAFRKSGLEKVYIFNKDLIIKEPTTETVSEEEAATKTHIDIYSSSESVADFVAIPKNVTIYGYAGSTAEAYAQTNGNPFVNISEDSYKVTFDAMGGSAVEEQQVKAGEVANEPEAPTRDHYVFKGWYTNQDYKKAFDFDTEIDSDITLYAKWEKEVYTVSFDSAGGSAAAEQKVAYQDKAEEPEAPTKDHYVFKGWYTDQDYKKVFDFATEIDSDITLYAKWEKAVYTVSFDSAGGSVAAEQKVAYQDKAEEPEAPTKDHYVFKGWYTDQDYKKVFDFATEIDSDITLYAKWEKAVYTVSFDSAGGSVVPAQKVTYEGKVTKPADPKKASYIFKGWYTDKGCTIAFNFEKDIVQSNALLYAKWEKEQPAVDNTVKKNDTVSSGKYTYKVTGVAKDQTGTVEFTGNATGKKSVTVTIPSTVTINGKKFKVTSIAPKAFQKNKTVKKVVIGNNVKTIGTKAFYGMKKLQTVVIGKNVTTIKSQAFGNLPKLKKVTVKSKKLKKVHKKAFKPVKHKFTIKVPKAKKAKYKKLMKTYRNLIR